MYPAKRRRIYTTAQHIFVERPPPRHRERGRERAVLRRRAPRVARRIDHLRCRCVGALPPRGAHEENRGDAAPDVAPLVVRRGRAPIMVAGSAPMQSSGRPGARVVPLQQRECGCAATLVGRRYR